VKKSALTAVKIEVIYLSLGWTEGNFADVVGVPRKQQRLMPLYPIEKNKECFLCPCKAKLEHPGAELKSLQDNLHPNCAPSILAVLSQEGCVGKALTRETEALTGWRGGPV